jgi:hypothetical protein
VPDDRIEPGRFLPLAQAATSHAGPQSGLEPKRAVTSILAAVVPTSVAGLRMRGGVERSSQDSHREPLYLFALRRPAAEHLRRRRQHPGGGHRPLSPTTYFAHRGILLAIVVEREGESTAQSVAAVVES